MRALVLSGCLVGVAIHCVTPRLPVLQVLPRDASTRRESLDQLGRALFEGLRSGSSSQNLARSVEVAALIDADARFRVMRERHQQHVPEALPRQWARARYLGFCAQGARQEVAHNGFGLNQPAWVLERMLLAVEDGATRSAAWIEGRFVYTDQGWKTLSLTRIEAPRPQHSDLELAPCDVEAGLR